MAQEALLKYGGGDCLAHILRVRGSDGAFYEVPAVKGTDGKNGIDGTTPHIGSNGDWFIGENDTGISAYQSQKSWRLINSVTLEEDVSEVFFDTDSDGNSIACDDFQIKVIWKSDWSTYIDDSSLLKFRLIKAGSDASSAFTIPREAHVGWHTEYINVLITRYLGLRSEREYRVQATSARYETGLRPQYTSWIGYATKPKLEYMRMWIPSREVRILTGTKVYLYGR